METLIHKIFIQNWQQKTVALLTAIVLWFFVSYSIMETKIVPSIPIRVVNLPPESTILGLMPNGILHKRITLTVTGTKDVVDRLEPGDLEVVLDGSIIDHSDWVLRITKNNLVSLDPSIDLKHHISNVTHSEYVIKLRKMLSAEIPITMLPPKGEAPPGYEFLDIWPQDLTQTYNGADEEIQTIKKNGLEFQLNLSRITVEDLDSISKSTENANNNEVTYYVPSSWKKVMIPCKANGIEEINDPESAELQINFLHKRALPVQAEIPIRVFYPPESIATVNPDTYPLAITDSIRLKEGITFFTPKLFMHNVTQEFLDTVRDHLELVITAGAELNTPLKWSAEIVNYRDLENRFIQSIFKNYPKAREVHQQNAASRESLFRKRFQEYMENLELYNAHNVPLEIHASMQEGKITIHS